jgi:hypothetical protein
VAIPRGAGRYRPRAIRANVSAVQLRPDRVVPWRPDGLTVDPWTVLRLARYRRRDDVPPPVWDATRAMAARAGELATPAAGLRLVHIGTATDDRVSLTEGPRFSGHAVARHLTGARRAIAFILTLGPALEAEVATLGQRQDLLEAYLLDLAGWAGIETAVRGLRRDLVAALPRARVSHRLGPGHRDWPLTEQHELVALLETDAAPVRLSEHGVLIPFKSISGLFALRDSDRAIGGGIAGPADQSPASPPDPTAPSREDASDRSVSARREPAPE